MIHPPVITIFIGGMFTIPQKRVVYGIVLLKKKKKNRVIIPRSPRCPKARSAPPRACARALPMCAMAMAWSAAACPLTWPIS